MNRVEYIGRLTKDGEVSSSTSGNTYYRNTIAVDRKFKREGEPTVDFFSFTMFGKAAETFEKYTHKGSKVFLAGRNQTNSYTNKEGAKVYDVSLIVDEFEFLDSKESEDKTKPLQDFLNIADNSELPFN